MHATLSVIFITVSKFIVLTGRVMFTVTLSLGGRGYEREVTIALFEMDAGISVCREHFIMEEWMSNVGFRMNDQLLQILITMNAF